MSSVGAYLESAVHRPAAKIAISVSVGILAFVLALAVFSAATTPDATSSRSPTALAPPPDALSRSLAPNRVGVAAPASANEALLAEVRTGDRLDVIALLPAAAGRLPIATIVVRGAAVMGRAGGSPAAPVLLEVSADEALVLTHLLQSGVRLTYLLWPAAGPEPPLPPVDLAAIRNLLDPAPAAAAR